MMNDLMIKLMEHDLETYDHSVKVAELASNIAMAMGYSEYEQRVTYYCGLLHDIGKLKISTRILKKTSELTPKEWRTIRMHPILGFQLLNQLSPAFKDLKYKVLFHRERLDGSGYPFQLTKKEIPIISRIVAVADCFEAMTRERAYRRAMSEATAFEQIYRQKGVAFDAFVVDGLRRLLRQRKAESHPKALKELYV